MDDDANITQKYERENVRANPQSPKDQPQLALTNKPAACVVRANREHFTRRFPDSFRHVLSFCVILVPRRSVGPGFLVATISTR